MFFFISVQTKNSSIVKWIQTQTWLRSGWWSFAKHYDVPLQSGYLTMDLRSPSRCRQWWARGVQFVADTFPACDEPPGDVTRSWQAITNEAEYSLQHLIWACLCLGWLRYLNPDELTWRDMPLDNFSILQDLGVDKKRTIYLKTLTVGIFQSQRNASTWERRLRRQKI